LDTTLENICCGLVFKKPFPVVAMKPQEAQQVFERDLINPHSTGRICPVGIVGRKDHNGNPVKASADFNLSRRRGILSII
jgi:hypothetical protein